MTKRRRISLAISGIGAIGAGAIAASVMAGPEKISFPEGFEKGVLYAVVDRHDVKRYHELYSTPEAVKAVREGKPIPHGTVLINVQYTAKTDDKGVPLRDAKGHFVKGDLFGYGVMEKRKGWGAEYPAEWRNGEWEYAAFTKDRKPNAKANANTKNCFVCHKPHAGQDFVMSLASLSGTAPGAPVAKQSGPGIVSISDFLFGPQKITVKPGTTINWVNTDDSPHQVTVQASSELRSPVLLKGHATQITFNDVGTYDYICGLHPGMRGTVEVTK